MFEGIETRVVAASVCMLGLFALTCGDNPEGASGWQLGNDDLEVVRKGLYELEVEVERDECTGPTLEDIVDSNRNWPPRESGVRLYSAPERPISKSVRVRGYNLRTLKWIGVQMPLRGDATPITLDQFRVLRKAVEPPAAPGRCGPQRQLPLYEAVATLTLEDEERFELEVEVDWDGYAECVNREQRERMREDFPWLPNNMPCSESYTYTYRLDQACPSNEGCRVDWHDIPYPDSPNSGFDHRCECPPDIPETDDAADAGR